MPKQLEGTVAVVTGADSGIGAEIAKLFAANGAAVAIDYLHDEAGARATRDAIHRAGGRAHIVQADVSDEAAVEALFTTAERELGAVSILVNNAGRNASGNQVLDMSFETWTRTIATNLTGVFLCSRRFARARRHTTGGGKIVTISSVHEEMPAIGVAEYCAAKGGLRMFTRCLALELAIHKINVNNIAPGTILTPMNQDLLDDPTALHDHEQTIPWKRAGVPADIAAMALFLASDAADYITGTTFAVDGGMLLNVANGIPN
jgi:glucose 1-dehydrogenase